jgi:UDP-2-acetamido-3-amino-2,3-dideoxy-glucuronate N-acetyltransferase
VSGLTLSDRAPGLYVADDVVIPDDAEIGVHVVIHSGVHLGARCVLQDQVVVGKKPILRSVSRAPREQGPTRIGDGVSIGTGAVIGAGAEISAGTIVGDRASMREQVKIGPECLIGGGVAFGWGVTVGARTGIWNLTGLAPGTVVEDDIYIGPGVWTTDHQAMGHYPQGRTPLSPVTIRRGARIATGVVFLPGVEIGAEAVVGAGSVVTHDVPARSVAFGVPARVVRSLDE